MLHAFERVVSDVLLIGCTSFQNEIYSHAKRIRKSHDLIVEFDIEKNLKKSFSFDFFPMKSFFHIDKILQ